MRNSDATLVLIRDTLAGGTLFSVEIAHSVEKPVLVVNIYEQGAFDKTESWLNENNVAVLNISGPRESEEAGIYAAAKPFIDSLLR
ncbi:MAG: putative molybdenum carrier protein [Acidobacteriota bacterium]